MNDRKSNNNIFNTGQNEVNQMKENLAKLYNLTDEEKTEEGLLQARIEEQSHLIMMLKKRADEYLLKYQSLERENKELEAKFVIMSNKSKADDKKYRVIYQNYGKLTQEYDEMKVELENVKEINEKMKQQTNHFKSEICSLSKQLENYSGTDFLKEEIASMKFKNNQLETDIKSLNKKYSQNVLQHQHEISKANETIDSLNEELKEKETNFSKTIAESEKLLENLRKENTESINEIGNLKSTLDSQARIIKKNGDEMKELTKKNNQVENLYKDLKEKYQRDSENLNVNTQIQKLKIDLKQEENKYRELRQDYEAYKSYSNKLLQTERELSSRLRKLYS